MLGLPERLRRVRRGRKIRQKKLAELAKVSQPTISALEKGHSLDGVTAAVVTRLAMGLRLNPGWLLTGLGPAELAQQEAFRFDLVEDQGRAGPSLGPEIDADAPGPAGRKRR